LLIPFLFFLRLVSHNTNCLESSQSTDQGSCLYLRVLFFIWYMTLYIFGVQLAIFLWWCLYVDLICFFFYRWFPYIRGFGSVFYTGLSQVSYFFNFWAILLSPPMRWWKPWVLASSVMPWFYFKNEDLVEAGLFSWHAYYSKFIKCCCCCCYKSN
jgi:hypothetical protein